ncbi:MAG: M20 family peptidase, partial [Candidatus Lokiarchaeota archaeon]|nr:M20 family peptidase [Candidatus Lokiarchaeota archaeon]
MEEIEKKVLDRIDEMRDEIIKFHQRIIQIPSENPPSKYKEVANFTEAKMKEMGLITNIKRNNVIGEFGNSNGKTLILNGHYDTVEAFKKWTKDPFGGEIIDGKIYGRGASDDKSSVTAELFAIKALLELGIKLNGKVILTAVGDEETGGLRGVEYLLSSGLVNGDACLLGDAPCDYLFGYTGGTMYITFTINGKQAHGLGFPDHPVPYRTEQSGINSLERMLKIMNFLMKIKEDFLKRETKYSLPERWTNKISSVNLAEIHGGNKITTVPDKTFLHCSINTIPEQDIASIKKKILDYVNELKKEDPYLDISIQIPIAMEPFVIDEKSDFAQAALKAT